MTTESEAPMTDPDGRRAPTSDFRELANLDDQTDLTDGTSRRWAWEALFSTDTETGATEATSAPKPEPGGPQGRLPIAYLTLLGALAVVSTVPLATVFANFSFVLWSIAGAVGAATTARLLASRRLLGGEVLVVSALAFVALGALVTIGPRASMFGRFVDGLVGGWSDLLSAIPPVELSPELRVLPFTLSWIATGVAIEAARVPRVRTLACCAPLTSFVVAVLFGTWDRPVSLPTAGAMLAGTLLLMRLTADDDEAITPDGATKTNLPRATAAGVSIAALAIGLPFAMSLLAPVEDRFDLRDYQQSPWDALALPSPLVDIKTSLKDANASDIAFTVVGGPPADRWPIATLNHYTGVFWAVADPEVGGNAAFRPVDRLLPSIEGVAASNEPATHTIIVGDALGHWVPTAGKPIRFDSDEIAVRMNQTTGTLANPAGLSAGDRYEVTSIPSSVLTIPELDLAVVNRDGPDTAMPGTPPSIGNIAADLTVGNSEPGAQLAAIADMFVNRSGYLADESVPPGHSYNRIASFVSRPNQIRGFEEQYAASAAVLGRSLGIATRVVVGYRVPQDRLVDGSTVVLAGDMSAWIEVATSEGWQTVDVTPDRLREPSDEDYGRLVEERSIADPPPAKAPTESTDTAVQEEESPNDSDEEEDDETLDDDDETEPLNRARVLRVIVIAAAVVAAPALLAGSIGLIIAALKLRRSRNRRSQGTPDERIAGAWAEILDRATELGVVHTEADTPHEATTAIATHVGDEADLAATLAEFSVRVERAAFHPAQPSDADASNVWACVDEAGELLRSPISRWQRLRWAVDPRPLLQRGATKQPVIGSRARGTDVAAEETNFDVFERLDA